MSTGAYLSALSTRLARIRSEWTKSKRPSESEEGSSRATFKAVPIRPAGHVLHDGAEEIVGGIDLDVERQRAAVEARDIQQVGDETIQPIRLLFDYQRPFVAQRLELVGESLDRGQGRSQIVREGSQKRILEFVGFAQCLRTFHRRPLRSGAIKKLGGHQARYEKRDEHDPVERIANE